MNFTPFKSFLVRSSVILALIAFSTACHDHDIPDGGTNTPPATPSPSAWIDVFKKELARTEQRFFQDRYLQKKVDPFYLNDVVNSLTPGQKRTAQQKELFTRRRDDFAESWPMLTRQLERTQLIFAATSVVPAVKAMLLLSQLRSTPDPDGVSDVLKFKDLVVKGTTIDVQTLAMDLAPEFKADVIALANKIATHVLDEIATLGPQASGSVGLDLERLAGQIRLLNFKAAAEGGKVDRGDDPVKLWAELKGVYDKLFTELAAVHPHGIAELQKRETSLLSEVVDVTERQFKVATDLVSQ